MDYRALSSSVVTPTSPAALLSVGLGLLAIASGVRGHFAPAAAAAEFGLAPDADADTDSAYGKPFPTPADVPHRAALARARARADALFQVAATRNMAVGVCVVVFALTEQRRALATVLAAVAVSGPLDAAVVAANGKRGMAVAHAVSGVVVLALAAAVLR